MVALLGLSGYSPEQLTLARQLSPALATYDTLLTEPSLSEINRIRHEAWIRCVLASYFQTATPDAVCASWSDTADTLLKRAWNECGLNEFDATLIALGKHGAQELNLSSDIDLIVISTVNDAHQVERAVRKFQTSLQATDVSGLCYRLDFDLRPGGTMGPLITTPSRFRDHYWSQGETWERLALVRIRFIAGNEELSRQVIEDARKFSYRKFLDFTLLDDLKAMRTQVHQKGFQRREGELHLKLEVGGIRDIELFIHSLLVMNGGKLPELQTRSTSAAIAALGDRKILPQAECKFLNDTYWYYRHQENLVQSVDDRQTHSLTSSVPLIPGLAKMTEVASKMDQVDRIVSTLLGQVDLESTNLPLGREAQILWLQELGFSDQAIAQNWEPLINATALSYKNARDERARRQFLYSFVVELARNHGLDRDLGLSLLLDFVKATRAKATFFTMLIGAPKLIQDLARVFCLSPYLGSIVASRPELLDHFILKVDEPWSNDIEALLQQMAERKLMTELWAANQFIVDQNLESLCTQITLTADDICTQLLIKLKHEYPESRLNIVALGKWAGKELGLRSDLDFIFVTPGPPNESDYKVARRFITRLTESGRGGRLYDIDLRLRPSGQSGTLLVSQDRLKEYWSTTAQAWERQAYLRARSINPEFKLEKSTFIARGLTETDLEELKVIRSKLMRKATGDSVEIKYAPGGLLEIELLTQTAVLRLKLQTEATSTAEMIRDLVAASDLWKKWGVKLLNHYLRLRVFDQALRLSSTHKTEKVSLNHPVFKKAAVLLNTTEEAAWEEIQSLLNSTAKIIANLVPNPSH